MTHCLQFDKLGLWKSKPVANILNWKWEGYAEYVSRHKNEQKDHSKNIARLILTDKRLSTTFAILLTWYIAYHKLNFFIQNIHIKNLLKG